VEILVGPDVEVLEKLPRLRFPSIWIDRLVYHATVMIDHTVDLPWPIEVFTISTSLFDRNRQTVFLRFRDGIRSLPTLALMKTTSYR
jgi:hypothetical protein